MRILFVCVITLIIVACGHPDVPTEAQREDRLPNIYPDYTEVTMPANICPPNFMMCDGSEKIVARLSCGDKSFTYGDNEKAVIDEGEWAELRQAAKGGAVKVEVFAMKGNTWKAYKPFNIYIANETIDPYLSYRVIQPSYVTFEDLVIEQRCIENFESSDIYNNQLMQTENGGQCINCHSYQNYGTDNMLFHVRINYGGTLIISDNEMRKVNLKTDSTISAGVYPAWHPAEKLIAFSTNKTQQSFFTKDKGKIEVFDTESDLILYDIEKNTVSNISNEENEFESFPTWSPDGKTLYYTSAHFEYTPGDTTAHTAQIMQRYQEVKYNIYKRSFDIDTRRFGPQELVFDAVALGKSATLPRLSPDGRYLIFALGSYGCFHVWHPDADIYMIDIKTSKVSCVNAINSKQSESYPTFSSNGRWIMTDSRRDDGNYTRPVIAYFDKNGKCHKPFTLPQKDPEFFKLLLRSYNRPEFMKEAVKVSAKAMATKLKEDAASVKFQNP